MRTLTGAQDDLLQKRRRSTFARVFIDRGSADWVDMTTLEGFDWVDSIEQELRVDQPVAVMTIGLKRARYDLSLSPLMSLSKLNASGTILELGHPIYVETATLAEGSTPEAADWVEVFRGEIDEIDWGSNPIRLKCRDNGGELDRFIETQRKYPEDPVLQDDIETVIQDIIDAELGGGAVTLYSITGTGGTPFQVLDSPGFQFSSYIQKKQPLMTAIRRLAAQIGYELRYIWNSSTGAFQLTLFEPGRELAARGTMELTGQPANNDTFDLNATTFTAKSSSPGADEFQIGTTAEDNVDNIVDIINTGSESANALAWKQAALTAAGRLTLTGQPANNETFAINATTVTAKTSGAVTDQFNIGSSLTETARNIAQAVKDGTEDVNVSVREDSTGVVFFWRTKGTVGNSVTFTEAMSNTTVTGAGTLGTGFRLGVDWGAVVQWGTLGTAGNSIVWTESMSNTTMDGSGTIGGTRGGAGVAAVRTFDSDQYHDIGQLAINRSGIRNVVRVKYGIDQADRTVVTETDAASISKYGRRYMEIAEAGTSQIDTLSEAQTMADAILNDLSEPDADHTIQMPYFWPAELGDLYTFLANGVHYDTDQTLAVLSIRHSLNQTRSRTTLALRGKTSGGFKRWLEMEARDGVAAQNDFYSDEVPQGSAGSVAPGTIIIDYDDPRGMNPPITDWSFTEIYVADDGEAGFPDFTPDATTLRATTRSTHVEIADLVPGADYAVKLQFIDSSGNVGATSTYIEQTTQRVGPYHENNEREFGAVNPNPNFGVFTLDKTTNEPDFWDADLVDWGTDDGEWYFAIDEQLTGEHSLLFNDMDDPPSGIAVRQFVSDAFVVEADVLYLVEFAFRRDNTRTPGRIRIAPGYIALDEDKAGATDLDPLLNTRNDWQNVSLGITPAQFTANTWFPDRGWFKASSGDVYAKVGVRVESDSADSFGQPNYWIDKLIVSRAAVMLRAAGFASDRSIAANTWVQPWMQVSGTQLDNAQGFTNSIIGPLTEHSYIVPFDGEYSILGKVQTDTLAAGQVIVAKIQNNAADFEIGMSHVTQGAAFGPPAAYISIANADLSAGDVITLHGKHDDGAGGISLDSSECFLHIFQISKRAS